MKKITLEQLVGNSLIKLLLAKLTFLCHVTKALRFDNESHETSQ